MGNSLTKVALAGHLKLLNIATHHSIKKLASPFTLISKYDSRKTSFKIQCVFREKQCKQLLVCGGDGHPTLLQNCGHKLIRNNSHCCFILQLLIEQQLLYFMEHHHGLPVRIITTSWPQHPKWRQLRKNVSNICWKRSHRSK